MGNVEKSKRQVNYELLRIIAMFMVVTLHYLNHAGVLPEAGGGMNGKNIAGMLIESFCIVAVNVYVLISGYFLVEAGFKVKRIAVLLCQILFYALLIPLIMMGTGMFAGGEEGGAYGLIRYIFPIQTEHYWFATSYVLMYLFTPVMNIAVRNMSRKQLQMTIAGLLLPFCVMKSVVPVQFVTDRFGYDFGWFLCVYLVAAYLRLYGCRMFRTAKRSFGIYAGCCFGIFVIAFAAWQINRMTGLLSYYMAVPWHYNYLLCLIGAAALFYGFRYVKVKEGKFSELILRLAPLTFGVYLFHEHMEIRGEWTGWIEDFIGPVAECGVFGLIVHLLVSVLLVYAAGTFIDVVRLNSFHYIGRHLKRTKLCKWLEQLDEEFSKKNPKKDGTQAWKD